MAKGKFYAVLKGRNTGIYHSWNECKVQINGFSGAIYKSFSTLNEARDFLDKNNSSSKKNKESDYCAYVDGSYIDNRYSWAYVIYHQGKIIAEKSEIGLSKDAAKMRNVAGEIEAAINVVHFLVDNKIDHITIYYDYEGIEKWAKKIWNANLVETKKYQDFMEPYLSKITFKKVKGHSGIEGNEYVDKLAKKALGII